MDTPETFPNGNTSDILAIIDEAVKRAIDATGIAAPIPAHGSVEVNVLAQRFYEAAGLNLYMHDKGRVVDGLNAVFDHLREKANEPKRVVKSHTTYSRVFRRSSVWPDLGASALTLTHGTRGISLGMRFESDHESRGGVMSPAEARDLAAELIARAEDVERRITADEGGA